MILFPFTVSVSSNDMLFRKLSIFTSLTFYFKHKEYFVKIDKLISIYLKQPCKVLTSNLFFSFIWSASIHKLKYKQDFTGSFQGNFSKLKSFLYKICFDNFQTRGIQRTFLVGHLPLRFYCPGPVAILYAKVFSRDRKQFFIIHSLFSIIHLAYFCASFFSLSSSRSARRKVYFWLFLPRLGLHSVNKLSKSCIFRRSPANTIIKLQNILYDCGRWERRRSIAVWKA